MNTEDETSGRGALVRTLWAAALTNMILWALSIIALIVLIERARSPRELFVMLAAGVAVASRVLAVARKLR